MRAVGEDLATGEDAEVEVIFYDLWSAVAGEVDAKKWTMTVVPDSGNSGAGGEKLGFSGTLHGNSDPVEGVYNLTSHTFTETVIS